MIRSRAGVVVDGSNKVLWIPESAIACAVSKNSRNIVKILRKPLVIIYNPMLI